MLAIQPLTFATRSINIYRNTIQRQSYATTGWRGLSPANTESPSRRVSVRLTANKRTALSSSIPEIGSTFHAKRKEPFVGKRLGGDAQ